MATDNIHRYRLAVPDADTQVMTWVATQSNLSLSLRLLIRQAIAEQGYTDIFARAMDSGVFAAPVPVRAQVAPDPAPVSAPDPAAPQPQPAPAQRSDDDLIRRMQGIGGGSSATSRRSMQDMLNG